MTWTVEIAGGNIDNLNLRLHDTFDEKQDYVAGSFALNGISISDSELAPEAAARSAGRWPAYCPPLWSR